MSFAAKAKTKTKELAPAIVHSDGTCRLQTLSRKSNPELYELISKVYSETGIPILMNTSLNVAGLPICNTV
jgi:carbamoyltransferase